MTSVCMSKDNFNFEDDGRYYTELAAAFVRGKIGVADALSPEEAIGLFMSKPGPQRWPNGIAPVS